MEVEVASPFKDMRYSECLKDLQKNLSRVQLAPETLVVLEPLLALQALTMEVWEAKDLVDL